MLGLDIYTVVTITTKESGLIYREVLVEQSVLLGDVLDPPSAQAAADGLHHLLQGVAGVVHRQDVPGLGLTIGNIHYNAELRGGRGGGGGGGGENHHNHPLQHSLQC